MSSSKKWTKDNISFPEYVENTLDKDKQGGAPLVGPGYKLEFDKFAAPFKLAEELYEKTTPLSIEHFKQILGEVIGQVSRGKGEVRHGHGRTLQEQPWKAITDNVGTGFVLGQAMKKLMELRSFKDIDAWKREALGAIVYIVFAIMFVEKEGKV